MKVYCFWREEKQLCYCGIKIEPHRYVGNTDVMSNDHCIHRCSETVSQLHHVENFMPPFAQMTDPVHHPLSGVHNIAITPAMSVSYACTTR